ncbi:hypothetical protein [Paenibacillus agricola]|uniref:Spore coat protein n=1 Tax=Paenibacillus agricola TaxID=2716264 RepID=A0ABX0J3P3_9BACL|nr:hypothetical protein [Paenibacillus agricola]NHN30608.1 hypothetical protein [Paenibacillus agricola]
MMQPMTAKELEYVADSMSNESLIIKQCTVLAASTQQAATYSLCMEMLNVHNQHYHKLMQTLHEHIAMAPTQPTQ